MFAFVHVCSRSLAFACVFASAFACVCPLLSAFACVCSHLLAPPLLRPPLRDTDGTQFAAAIAKKVRSVLRNACFLPKDPAVQRVATALEVVVFHYRHHFSISVPLSCLFFPRKTSTSALRSLFCTGSLGKEAQKWYRTVKYGGSKLLRIRGTWYPEIFWGNFLK